MSLLNLDSAAISLGTLREAERNALFGILSQIEGKKTIIIDPFLESRFSLILERDELYQLDVDFIHKMTMTAKLPGKTTQNIVYILRPDPLAIKAIGTQIMAQRWGEATIHFSAILVPGVPPSFRKMLDSVEGGGASLYLEDSTYSLPLYWIPLETDVLSMEVTGGDASSRSLSTPAAIAAAIGGFDPTSIESVAGRIGHIRGKGVISKQIAELLVRQSKFGDPAAGGNGEGPTVPKTPEISQLIIVDRSIDLMTPLLVQMTYEGMLYELMEVSASILSIPNTVFGGDSSTSPVGLSSSPAGGTASKPEDSKIAYPLSSIDPLFPALRDMNIASVLNILTKETQKVKDIYEQRKGLEAESLAQVGNYVQRLKEAKRKEGFIKAHLKIVETLKDKTRTKEIFDRIDLDHDLLCGSMTSGVFREYPKMTIQQALLKHIQTLIASQSDLFNVLRLISLVCLTTGGIEHKRLFEFKREICQVYGIQHLFTLINLQKAGFIFEKGTTERWYDKIRKKLELINEDVDVTTNNEEGKLQYYHNFYSSILVKLIEMCIFDRMGPEDKEAKMFAMLPGPYFDIVRDESGLKNNGAIAVMVVGGITPAEISALRCISYRNESVNEKINPNAPILSPEIIVLTTGIVTGHSLIAEHQEAVSTGTTYSQPPGTEPKSYNATLGMSETANARTIRLDG